LIFNPNDFNNQFNASHFEIVEKKQPFIQTTW